MRKGLIIAGVVVLILFILIGVIANIFGTKKAPQTSVQPTAFPMATSSSASITEKPADFVHDFYVWYLGTGDQLSTSNYASYNQNLDSWITPDFHSQLDGIIEDTDANPFLISQDVAPSWKSNIAATYESTNESTSDATVSVILGTGTEQQTLLVTVVPDNGQWRISSVTQVGSNNF